MKDTSPNVLGGPRTSAARRLARLLPPVWAAFFIEAAHIYPNGSKQKDCFTLTRRNEMQQKLLEIMEIEQLHNKVC